ncbi:MAG: trypsin-like peptidase domain-containing protein [Gemmatimonadota bacterium]|nr:trypsin-like peptidase domain-containing protein [Gemmatimonadota bacterium]
MTIELRVLSGARNGQHDRFAKSVITLGRHPLCDFRFDPTEDLDVSARHAELRLTGGRVSVRDTGSTNGTWVNGARVSRERDIASGDVISLGEMGPRVEVRITAEGEAPTIRSPAAMPATAISASDPNPTKPRPARPSRSTTMRLIAVMGERVERMQMLLGATFALLVVGIAAAYWLGGRGTRARDAQLGDFTRRIDSLQASYSTNVTKLSGRVVGLDSSLLGAQRELQTLRAEAASARGGQPGARSVERIKTDVDRAVTKQRAMLGVDHSATFERNGPAVVLLAVELPGKGPFTGTGFAVTTDGTIVTSKHLVQNAGGERASKIVILFGNTHTWVPAHVVRVSDSSDVALIKADSPGPFPVVEGIATSDTPRVGSPVSVIGFPLGVELPMDNAGTAFTARSTLAAGMVSKALPELLQIDSFAAEGSSGSPVFDATGRVVGVVYGGARESSGRIVFAVPASAVANLLAQH